MEEASGGWLICFWICYQGALEVVCDVDFNYVAPSSWPKEEERKKNKNQAFEVFACDLMRAFANTTHV